MVELLLHGLNNIFTPGIILIMIAGIVIGIVAGAIPGLNAGIAIALMLPITYRLSFLPSLVFLTSIYTGGVWGGAITAILINAPGSPAAIATTF
ncbi:MAG: C4-dicarboxylate ABC transporter permease, partial [Deltaproteobacteria bacterium]